MAIKTSVIIPVYNTADYLEECLESVLAQTQKEIEIIVIDDGSDDGSREIARSYAERYPFIRLICQEHLYQGTARNRGLEIAQGEYVYFMDSDDAILPELFEKCYRLCEEQHLDFAMFDAEGFRYDENDRALQVPDDIVDRRQMGIEDRLYDGREFWNTFYNRHGILYVCWLLYIRRSFLLEHDLYYEERTYFEDNDWMLRMYLHAERTRYLPEILHRHRWRRGSNMLDGFTTGLLEGCFRMHKVLLDLHAAYEGRDASLHMIEDVLYLNLRRFDRLAEIVPAKGYLHPLEDFCAYLENELTQMRCSEFDHFVHLAAAVRILRASGTWEDGTFAQRWAHLVNSGAVFRIPSFEEDKVIAVYGTGKIGRYCAQLLREYVPASSGKVFFVDTWKEDGTFCGYPLYNSRRLPELRPDVVVIASTKYPEEMRKTAAALCGGTADIVHAPGEMKFFVS